MEPQDFVEFMQAMFAAKKKHWRRSEAKKLERFGVKLPDEPDHGAE